MNLSAHKAAVGRKLWLWMNSLDGVKSPAQAFDATVVHVHPDATVDVRATTHTGAQLYMESLEVYDPAPEEDPNVWNDHNPLMDKPYCTWMPYQKKQMDKQEDGK